MKRISVFLLRGVLLMFALLPLRVHYALARFLAWLTGSVLGYRRDDVLINLARAFPEKKYEEISALRKEFYRHLADIIVETIWFGGSSLQRLRKAQIARFVNPEEAGRLLGLAPSVVILRGHTGNWELMGGIEAYMDENAGSRMDRTNFVVTYKRFSSPTWDEVIRLNRTNPVQTEGRRFEGYVESSGILRYIIEHKQDKKFYIFNTDQSPYNNKEAGMEIRFMNQLTKTMTAAARLAHKFGFAVAYLDTVQIRRGHYELCLKTICEDASQISLEEIMVRYYGLLEENIRRNPAYYLWSHRRWKMKV